MRDDALDYYEKKTLQKLSEYICIELLREQYRHKDDDTWKEDVAEIEIFSNVFFTGKSNGLTHSLSEFERAYKHLKKST